MCPQGRHASLAHHEHVLVGRMMGRTPAQAAMSVEEPFVAGCLHESDINIDSCAFGGAGSCWGHYRMPTKTG